jgi:hypothetical protein
MTMDYVRLGRSSPKMWHITLGGRGVGVTAERSGCCAADPGRGARARPWRRDALRFFSATEDRWNLVRGRSSAALLRRYSQKRGSALRYLLGHALEKSAIAAIAGSPRPWSERGHGASTEKMGGE